MRLSQATLWIVVVFCFSSSTSTNGAALECPCSEPALCEPIRGPPVSLQGELYGFYIGKKENGEYLKYSGRDLNFTHLTTLAWATDDDELTCIAHEQNVRVVSQSPTFNLTDFVNEPESMLKWVEEALQMVKRTFRDGIVFDYEDPQPFGSAESLIYADLIALTRKIFQADNPSYQISVCVAWSPDDIDGRGYPHKAFADASDLLYVMDYDVQSQITNAPCIASANAPYYGMIKGIERYLDLGIDPKKLVLGIPWYGYRYPCLNGTNVNDRFCPIHHVPFRGVPCSDAAGHEIRYSKIMSIVRNKTDAEAGELRWDDTLQAPFFNTLEQVDGSSKDDSRRVYQYWFDNPKSLRMKYGWAREHRLLGVGPYRFDFLDFDNSVQGQQDAREMWSALDAFFASKNEKSTLAANAFDDALSLITETSNQQQRSL